MELGAGLVVVFFFFNDTATTEIYTLSLHDALPISILRDEHLFNESVMSLFGDGGHHGVAVEYARQKELTGTLDALRVGAAAAPDEELLVVPGDNYVAPQGFAALLEEQGEALLASEALRWSKWGGLELEGDTVRLSYETPDAVGRLHFTGIARLTPATVARLVESDERHIGKALQPLLADGTTAPRRQLRALAQRRPRFVGYVHCRQLRLTLLRRHPLPACGWHFGHAAHGGVHRILLDAITVVVDELKKAADRKSTRLNSSHKPISYAVFCLKKKKSTLSAKLASLKP